MLTAHDVKFLTSCSIAVDEENFRLEALWLNWQRANLHRDFSPCAGCGAKTYEQHALDCKRGAAMVLVNSTLDASVAEDGTVRPLEKFGIPVTRENYLQLAFAGNPPQEPLDGEIEAELSLELQMADISNAPSAGDCGEPSHTTLKGFPICARCGNSTRNMNQLICAPCRSLTRLLLTAADRKWLREIGIVR